MANRDQLIGALRAAHEKGDTEAATRFAEMLNAGNQRSSEFPDLSTPADGVVKTIDGSPLSPDRSALQQAGDYGQAVIAGANRLAPSLAGMAVDTGTNVRNLGAAAYGTAKHALTGSLDVPQIIDPATQFGGSASFQRGFQNVSRALGGGDPFALADPADRTQQNLSLAGTVLASGAVNPASGIKQFMGNVGKMAAPAAGAVAGRETAAALYPGSQTAEAMGTIGGMLGGQSIPLVSRQFAEKTGLTSVFSKEQARLIAEKKVRRDLEKEGITRPDQMMDDMGPIATAADTNARLRGRSELIAQLPGPGREAAKFYTTRNEQAGHRLGQAIDDTVQGGRIDLTDSIQTVIDFNKNVANPLFKRAYEDYPIIKSTHEMQQIQAVPMVQDAMQMVNNTRNALGDRLPINPKKLSLEDWHDIRQEIDKIAFGKVTTTPMGKPIGDTANARILRNRIKSQLIKETGGEGGAFAKANKYYADDAQAMSGFEEGLKFETMRPAQIKKYLDESPGPQADAFRLGALQKVNNEALTNPDSGNVTGRVFKNPYKRAQVEQIMNNKADFDTLMKSVGNEKEFFATFSDLSKGSPTFKREALNEELNIDGGALMSVARGSFGTAALQVGAKLISRLRMPENQRAELAKILMTPGPAAKRRLFEIAINNKAAVNENTLSQLVAVQAAAK